jgi:hypothetical protein
MPPRTESRRVNLFRELSANLAKLNPELEGQYICPLCGKSGFTEKDVLGPQPKLTDEHCIPDGLGPTISVLTCAGCNNTAGSKIDSELHKRVRFEDFCKAQQAEPINVRMTIEDMDVGVDIIRTGGDKPRMDIRILAEQSNPEHVKKTQEILMACAKNGVTPNPMKIHFRANILARDRLVLISLLKAGYLLLFKWFGYHAIASPTFDPVRRQIRDYKSEELNVESIVLRYPIESLPETICFFRTSGAEGIAVPIALSKYTIGYFVIMPVNAMTYAKFDELHKRHQELKTRTFDCDFYPLDHGVI